MIQRQAIAFIALFLLVLTIAPSAALAQSVVSPQNRIAGPIVTCGNAGQPACTVCDLAKVANNILNTGIYIAVFLSAVLFAWAGGLYLTSAGGNSTSRAKEIFSNVVIGLVIILIGWLVVHTVIITLTDTPFASWYVVC